VEAKEKLEKKKLGDTKKQEKATSKVHRDSIEHLWTGREHFFLGRLA